MDEQMQSMMQQISTLPPEEQQAAMMRLFQDYSGQEGVMDQQLSQADALRNQQGPQGVQAGNQFVASNPLSHIASGIERFQGGQDRQAAIKAKQDLSAQRTQGMLDVAGNMIPQPAQPQPQQTQLAEMLRKYGINDQLAAGGMPNANNLNY